MTVILDSSAIIAALNAEPGQEPVDATIVRSLPLTVFDLDMETAIAAGGMMRVTRSFGLSLGDRICLALAAQRKCAAMTADRVWRDAGVVLGIEVRLIR